jgi:hypothetical protein
MFNVDILAKIENDIPTTGFVENGHPTFSGLSHHTCEFALFGENENRVILPTGRLRLPTL